MKGLKNFDTVVILLNALSKEEVRTLKGLLTTHRKAPKTLQIVEAILRDDQANEEDLKEIVSPGSPVSTFSTMLGDLRNKIYEVLAMDVNIHRKNGYAEYRRINFWARKKIISIDILCGRGLSREASELCEEVIQKCTDHEQYGPLIDALLFKKNLVAVHDGSDALAEVQKQVVFYKGVKESLDQAMHYFERLTADVHFHLHPEIHLKEVQKWVSEMESDYLEYGSKSQLYFLTRVKLYVLEHEKKLPDAIEMLLKLRQMILVTPAIHSPLKLGAIEMSIADVALRMNDSSLALSSAGASVNLFEEGSFNQMLVSDLKFLAEFHSGYLTAATSTMQQSLRSELSRKHPFYHAKRNYYLACVFLLRGRNKKAHMKIQETTALDKDKNGWNIAVRILDIMNQINWGGLYNSADAHIDNLYEHIRKTRKIKPISKRNLLILDILRQLVKDGFDFKETRSKMVDQFVRLSKDEEESVWDMCSPELIRFEAWFASKVRDVTYTYDLVIDS